MTIDNDDLMNSIIASLGRIDTIPLDEIPNIDLYMDQLTTFMDERLKKTTRHPETDKILTKTMINNYAKNDLLPPPVRKKYSKDHLILLIFIYYLKSILSINDIQTLIEPLKNRFHVSDDELNLSKIYETAFDLQKEELEPVIEDLKKKYKSKGFAAGCSREVIERGAAQLGWELDKLLTMTLQAMAESEDLIKAECA